MLFQRSIQPASGPICILYLILYLKHNYATLTLNHLQTGKIKMDLDTDFDSDLDMLLEGETAPAKSLEECKSRTQVLRLQLEQHEKDYAKLKRIKQDYFYENLGWIIILAVDLIFLDILCWARSLRAGMFLSPIVGIIELATIFLLAHVIYCFRHYIGMKDDKSGKFVTFHALLEDEQASISNLEKLVARSEKELEKAQAAADAKKQAEEDALPDEDRLSMRWDEQDVLGTSAPSLSDTAQLIRDALKEDE